MTKGIVLCGFMGAGKTHLGRNIARALHYRFDDLDELISTGTGMRIPEIFTRHGEPFFRQMERNYLRLHASESQRVLSLGGGALQHEDLVSELKSHNLLVFVNPSFETILSRIAGNNKRPLVLAASGKPKTTAQLRQDLLPLFEKRLPLYKQAHIEFVPDPVWSADQSSSALLNRIQLFDHDH